MKTPRQKSTTSRAIRDLALSTGLALLMPMAANAAELATFSSNNQTITATAGDTITGSYTVGGTGFNNNALQITGGGTVTQAGNGNGFNVGVVGKTGSSLLVDGAGSTFASINNFAGMYGDYNSITVSSGGNATLGHWGWQLNGLGSTVTVTGSGSILSSGGMNLNGANSFGVSVLAGGTFTTGDTLIGNFGSSNTFTVSGGGSLAELGGLVNVGNTFIAANDNALMIGTGGTVNVKDTANNGSGIIVQGQSGATGNKVQIDGGTLNVVSTGSSTPGINVVKGALILNSGNVTTEVLRADTDATSVVTFNGGTLTTSNTTISNSATFTVGNGTSAAALVLNGGSHSFANGLAISNNATLQLGASNVLNDTTTLTLSGGSFQAGGFSDTVGAMTLTNSTTSFLDFGSGTSVLLFSGITANTGTLAITNWSFGSDSLRFTSNADLLASSFTINGGSASILNQGTYYEVVPEPSTWALLAFSLTAVLVLHRRRSS